MVFAMATVNYKNDTVYIKNEVAKFMVRVKHGSHLKGNKMQFILRQL